MELLRWFPEWSLWSFRDVPYRFVGVFIEVSMAFDGGSMKVPWCFHPCFSMHLQWCSMGVQCTLVYWLPWRFYGISISFFHISMELPWPCQAISRGISWRFHRLSMEFYGFSKEFHIEFPCCCLDAQRSYHRVSTTQKRVSIEFHRRSMDDIQSFYKLSSCEFSHHEVP